jgi:hypothetical protein
VTVRKIDTGQSQAPAGDGPESPERVVVDVSGKAGKPGVAGARGDDADRPRVPGGAGGHATPPTPGEDAGNIVLQLQFTGGPEAGQSTYEIQARLRADQKDAIGDVLGGTFLPGSRFVLWADGGAGGPGGSGGTGGTGGEGLKVNGSARQGGPGGPAGRGSSGADGADGGQIVLQVRRSDLDALANVEDTRAEPGPGGPVGQHGDPGKGGPPGGGRGTLVGRDGKARTEPLKSGNVGKVGRVTIEVVEPDGSVTVYGERFQVSTTRVAVGNGEPVEPGEVVEVDLDLANTTLKMATPDDGRLSATLRPGGWVEEPTSQPLPQLAAGGQTSATVTFKVAADLEPHIGEPLDAKAAVATTVVANRAGVTLAESDKVTAVPVKYPVEISPMRGDRVVLPGGRANVAWEVKNTSTTKALGSDSDTERIVESILREQPGRELLAHYLIFRGPDGLETSLANGISHRIANLPPGESVTVEGTLEFRPDAPIDSLVELTALLNLGAIDNPSRARTIQAQELSLQLARKFAGDADAGIVVVVNNRTTKDEIKAWEDLAEQLGTKANIWNISLYGGLSLTQVANDSELGPRLAEKAVVVLNNDYDPTEGVSSPIGHLAEKDLLLAAVRQRTSTYVVGGSMDLGKHIFPDAPEGTFAIHESGGQFSRALKSDQAGVNTELGGDLIPARNTERVARRVAKQLGKQEPDQRHLVEVGPGSVVVTRGAGVSQDMLLHQKTADVHSLKFVNSPQNLYAVSKSLPLPAKLRAIDQLALRPGDRTLPVVYRALLADLAEEQQALRNRTWNRDLNRRDIEAKLSHLREVADHLTTKYAGVDPGSPQGRLVLDLLAEVGHMTDAAKSFGDKVLPHVTRRRQVLDQVSDRTLADVTLRLFGEQTPEGEKVPEGVRQALAEARAKLKQRDKGLTAKDRMQMKQYLHPAQLWSSQLTSDFDVWVQGRRR